MTRDELEYKVFAGTEENEGSTAYIMAVIDTYVAEKVRGLRRTNDERRKNSIPPITNAVRLHRNASNDR
jgi:hypothetical protein